MNTDYPIYGIWSVSTPDLTDGRASEHLGYFAGFVDEIALHLAGNHVPRFIFDRIAPFTDIVPTGERAMVTLNIPELRGIAGKELARHAEELFKRCNVTIDSRSFLDGYQDPFEFRITSINRKRGK